MNTNEPAAPQKKQGRNLTCALCGETLASGTALYTHYDTLHNGYRKNKKRNADPPPPKSPYELIREAEETIKQALLKIDEERHRLSQRILELDNLAAKYKLKP